MLMKQKDNQVTDAEIELKSLQDEITAKKLVNIHNNLRYSMEKP